MIDRYIRYIRKILNNIFLFELRILFLYNLFNNNNIKFSTTFNFFIKNKISTIPKFFFIFSTIFEFFIKTKFSIILNLLKTIIKKFQICKNFHVIYYIQ